MLKVFLIALNACLVSAHKTTLPSHRGRRREFAAMSRHGVLSIPSLTWEGGSRHYLMGFPDPFRQIRNNLAWLNAQCQAGSPCSAAEMPQNASTGLCCPFAPFTLGELLALCCWFPIKFSDSNWEGKKIRKVSWYYCFFMLLSLWSCVFVFMCCDKWTQCIIYAMP